MKKGKLKLSINSSKNKRINLYHEIANIYNISLLDFLNVKIATIKDMHLKYEFKKEFKQHLYYNIYQSLPGVLSSANDLSLLKIVYICIWGL